MLLLLLLLMKVRIAWHDPAAVEGAAPTVLLVGLKFKTRYQLWVLVKTAVPGV